MSQIQDFFGYYESLDKEQRAELRRIVTAKLRISEHNFWYWYARRTVPRWHRGNIADLLGIHETDLFPEKQIQLPEFSPKS
jgi:hypothetical protein